MVNDHGIKYAVHIITNHFGKLVAKVCECLLRRGPLTRTFIKQSTDLTDGQVKNSLLVLIQHNCIQTYNIEQQGDDDVPRFFTHYIALLDNILHRVRFCKFLIIVSQELDKECVDLFFGLLEHGRLTLKQMFDRTKSSQKEGNTVVLDSVRETLLRLVTARYVERCPAPEPVLTPENEDENPAKKRGSRFAKKFEEVENLEQRIIAAAAPMDAMRFSVITNSESDVDGETNMTDSSSMTVGEKRKHSALESDECGSADDGTVVYRANFEEFIRRLRHKACIDNVRARLDDGAVTVISAMVEATRSSETKVKTKNSVPLSLGSIYEEVIKGEAGQNMTFDHVRVSMTQLGHPPFVKASDDSYSIEFGNIIELAQYDEVESVVMKRHGRDAYRIFRLLSRAGRLLETDKISDATFVEKKETPKILYKLWMHDYLHMEKLVVAGARQTTFMVWKVNKNILWEHFLDEMFHAALNLSHRLAYELDQEKELLNLPADKRTGLLHDRYNRIKNVRILLESSLMKIDDSIMLFRNF